MKYASKLGASLVGNEAFPCMVGKIKRSVYSKHALD